MRYTWMLPCAVLGGVLMAACQVLIYRYAPVEQTMGLVQKIFYTHLPLAWWSFVSFFLVCVSGVAYLKTRNRHWDAVAGAAAEVGVVLSGLALVSGSIWARHSWGVWWTWDPRLTTTMILWFLYAGYLVLRKMDMPRERQANLCAVVGIVAFVDVPLVFLSARLWRSIHPAVFANKSGGLEPEMKIAAIAAREGTDIDQMIRDMVRESIAEAEAQKSPDRTDTPGFTPASRRRRARDTGDSE